MPSSRKEYEKAADDDFVSFAALHTSVCDEKRLRKAPRPTFTGWDYDPTRRPLTDAQSQRRDVDFSRDLTYRLKKLSTDLSAPLASDRQSRRRVKKNKEQGKNNAPEATELPRFKPLNEIESKPTAGFKVKDDDLSESSRRLGSKVDELRNLLNTTARRSTLGFPQDFTPEAQSTKSQITKSKATNKSFQSGSGNYNSVEASLGLPFEMDHSRDVGLWLNSDLSDVYASSFSVNVSPSEAPSKNTKNDMKIQTGSSGISDRIRFGSNTIQHKQEKRNETEGENSEKSTDSSDIIHGILMRIRNQPTGGPPVVRNTKHFDNGSRAELEEFYAQIGDLSLPAHMERGSNEDFWTRLGHSRGDLAQVQHLVNYTFDKSRAYIQTENNNPEMRRAEMKLFPTASLAKRYAQDRLSTKQRESKY